MNREYHKGYSKILGRDMELLVFGHTGVPTLDFPTSMGSFFEYEDRGMIGALGEKLESGMLQLFCVDSVDGESWYNKSAHPAVRVMRHMQYEGHVLSEVVPWIKERRQSEGDPESRLCATGCSFGGYHAMNFALRHPDLVTDCVTMGGAFDIVQFLDGYYDENCYFNCPPHYLANLGDNWYLERYRRNRYLLLTGEHDMCWDKNEYLAGIFRAKSIPHDLWVWRDQTGHDWPWWQRMAQVYLP